MLPAIWMSEACMNIAVNTVCQVGIVFGGRPVHVRAARLAGDGIV